MNRGRVSFLLIVLILFSLQLFGGEIRYNTDQKEFQLFNNSSNKILNYIVLHSGESIELQTIEVDSVTVYSRILGE